LIQICFICTFHQWIDPVINKQHLVSEIALYLILNLQVSAASLTDPTMRHNLGKLIIFVFCLTVIWNIAVCVYTLYYQINLIMLRKKNMRISAAKLLEDTNF